MSKVVGQKKNLLLCFDAFDTLFTPSIPIRNAYATAAARHGIHGDAESPRAVGTRFKEAFKSESERSPNYGKATGLGAEKWWGNVIHNTFSPFLKPGQQFPQALTKELLQRFSTSEGYDLYSDVKPFFTMLREGAKGHVENPQWPWERTVVGIITNSDDRIPGILESFGLKIGPRRIGTTDQRSKEASLEDDISFVVLSYDVGYEKPNRQIFDAATDMLKETLADNQEDLTVDDFEKLYVGDELEKDYDGARAAGWDSVMLKRNYVLESRNTAKHPYGTVELQDKTGNPRVVDAVRTMSALSSIRPQYSGVNTQD